MGHWSNDAIAMDVQTKLRKEECASDMGQRSHEQSPNDVADKNVLTKPGVEECAKDTEHIATQTMNQLHLDQDSTS